MTSTTIPFRSNLYHVEGEFIATVANYLLQGHIVMLDNEAVSEDYLESLFENIRDHLFELVQLGKIHNAKYHSALNHLITKSSEEGMDSIPIKPTIMIRIHTLASIEKC